MSDLFPPFAPDANEPRRRRFKPVPLRVLVPNVITLLALCLGLTAIRLGIEARLESADAKLEYAIICILIAAVLDGVDGRVARFLKGTSRFGAELDSLSDFVNFGVAPAFILYTYALKDLGNFGWIIALVFSIAMALRLARFNVMVDDPSRPDWQKDYFVGVPAPAGAMLSLLPIYIGFLGVPVRVVPIVVGVYVLFIAYLTVSRIPTFAGKTFGSRIPRQHVLPLFVLSVLIVALLVSYTFVVLAVGALIYLAFIPFWVARYRARVRAYVPTPPVAATEKPAETGSAQS